MKYIAAYMLAKLGGKESPTIEDLKRIIESVGIEFDIGKANEIISKLNGKDFNEVMNERKSKLSIAGNEQASQQSQQHQTIKEQNNENDQHEEETLELGIGDDFDDLFN